MAQVISNQSLAPLSELTSDFNIPHSYFFRFLQLSHAFSCQFPRSSPQLVQSALKDLLRSDCAKKPIQAILPFDNILPSNLDLNGHMTSQILTRTTGTTYRTFPSAPLSHKGIAPTDLIPTPRESPRNTNTQGGLPGTLPISSGLARPLSGTGRRHYLS